MNNPEQFILQTIWTTKSFMISSASSCWRLQSRVTRRLPFQVLQHQGVEDGATPFPRLLKFTLDPYHIMLSVKQDGIKYHFLSLWYDSTWDWTPVSRTIGEHSTH